MRIYPRQESVNQIWASGNKGDAFALTIMGLWLYEGKIVKQDIQTGFSILQQMASNVIWAKNLFFYIQNFPNNYAVSEHAIVSGEATQQMGEALQYNNVYAMTALGEMYYDGKVVPQNQQIGKHYISTAADMGCLWAQDLWKAIQEHEIAPTYDYSNVFDQLRNTRNSNSSTSTNTQTSQPSAQKSHNSSEELKSLIGLTKVKEEVYSLENYVKVQSYRQNQGLPIQSVSYHCVFSGSPGTGKTTVARIVANIYKELGILKKGHLVEVQRSDLVGEYLGQTAPKTNTKIDEALDGILFIDEAYTLSAGGEKDSYGMEAINTLLKRMEDDRDRLVVILAGYSNEIKQFINSNPGLESRFNRYIHFEDYSAEELLQIFQLSLKKSAYQITQDAWNEIRAIIYQKVQNKDAHFGNARYIRNLFEKVIQKQNNRLAPYLPNITREQLCTITAEDVHNLNN